MQKENVVYIYNEIWLGNKKWNIVIYDNMDGLREHYDTWNKSHGERQTPQNFSYMWNLKQAKQINTWNKIEIHPQIEEADSGQRGGQWGWVKH